MQKKKWKKYVVSVTHYHIPYMLRSWKKTSHKKKKLIMKRITARAANDFMLRLGTLFWPNAMSKIDFMFEKPI